MLGLQRLRASGVQQDPDDALSPAHAAQEASGQKPLPPHTPLQIGRVRVLTATLNGLLEFRTITTLSEVEIDFEILGLKSVKKGREIMFNNLIM